MSITHTQEPSVQRSERPTLECEPAEVYEEYVADDHTICSRCFRVQFALRTVAIPVRYAEDGEYGFDALEEADVGQETVLCQTQERTAAVETVHPPRVEGPLYDPDAEDPTAKFDVPLERKRANPPEKIVCRCGAIDQEEGRAPLGKQEAAEHALRIANRLEEAEIPHKRDLLAKKVLEWKSEPELASRDEDLFEHATRVAVGRALGERPAGIRFDDGSVVVDN
ncbi:hypothetical protein A6E15_19470 [Natrinema saccharevitans]|uniref:Uncharacterized protein n=1 Tax=Natrinema saccharevitans TaxID=301967 RepID=A0A1S8ARB2_9EURY|nr:hypothetical protein [Natrinema saccharevitans]OLZ39059.1 hypothetical protein A6E15_19025 [Natrinema saccharevitans]OLZ39145.1 hypothetical protein A6E15_19470 [Natrinema saccharevitans]